MKKKKYITKFFLIHFFLKNEVSIMKKKLLFKINFRAIIQHSSNSQNDLMIEFKLRKNRKIIWK